MCCYEVPRAAGGVLVAVCVLLSPLARAQDGAPAAPPAAFSNPPEVTHLDCLPPALPWHGKSLELVIPPDAEWATPFERSGLEATPSYDDTVAWLEKLSATAPELEMISLGKSYQGRDIWMVIASSDKAFTPEAAQATGKPILLVQAGIHSGEIDGKDAGMMLLRDITVRGTKRELLEGAILLFVPILSVDAHERRSPYNRMNQRGPLEMGWRTNARNLNLNRDYAKLDTPEMRSLVSALNRWRPDLYIDIHVTDGIDYQYDVTLGWNGPHAYSPHVARWLDSVFKPHVWRDLQAWGHVPGPVLFAVDDKDISKGIVDWTASPRFSNGYGDVRHLATVLVENHSLKPFRQRVLGTYAFLESTLRLLGQQSETLREATRADRSQRPKAIPLGWRPPDKPQTIEFLGVESRVAESEISGTTRIEWLGKPVTPELPYLRFTEPTGFIEPPRGYWIPPSWPEVIERVAMHGIEMEHTTSWREVEVEMYRLENVKLGEAAYEGHVTVTATPVLERRVERFPPGSAYVPVDQPLGELAVLLLEPASSDSFFQWGFFLEVLQRSEYFEAYVMEPIAEQMLAADPELKTAFEKALIEDEELAKNPRRRLEWFYERSPYADDRWRLYPVARVLRTPAPPPPLLIRNVCLFDAGEGDMTDPQDVLVDQGRIRAVGKVEGASGATEIDGSGKFALPGLFDCHTHLAMLTTMPEGVLEATLRRFVEKGVTQVRDVGGPLDVLKRLRERIEAGELVGPELFYAGPMLEKSPLTWGERNRTLPGFTVAVDTVEDVDRVLPELLRGGARLVKTFGKFDRPVYAHLVEKARELNLPVVHDPGPPLFHEIPMDVAIECGVGSIEHGKAPWPAVLEENLQKEHEELMRAGSGSMGQMSLVAKVCELGPKSVSQEKLHGLIDKMLEKDVYFCPTLEVFFVMEEAPDTQGAPPAQKATMQKIMKGLQRIGAYFTEQMVERGVKILVGQDGIRSEGTFAEMRHLADCGLPEPEIIKGATLYPAQFLGVADRYGSIAPGRVANLLLLDKNPLEEIENMESVHLVVQEGRVAFAKEGAPGEAR
ncbi:MAG: amidohydrolase family protein [Planctomycetota bacterium]